MKLASGSADVCEMLKRNINVAIGTDGAASNNCLDMFREMFLGTGLAKLKNKDASSIDAYEVLCMATINGAKSIGLNCGSIEVGKLADLIVLDLHQPNMQPIHNVAKNIVYSGSKQNVIMTMVNGKILYEKGKYYFDVDGLYEEVQRRVDFLMEG
jgi:5-methylthioadenosine/S-adenosylhomocysteine deaminase